MLSPRKTSVRIAGIAAIGGWITFIAAILLMPTPPTAGASARYIVEFAAGHQTVGRWAAFLFGVTATLFVVFAAGLRRVLRRAEGPDGWLADVAYGGAIVAFATMIVSAFLTFTLFTRGATQGEGVAVLLSDAVNFGFVFSGFGALLLVGASSVVMYSTGVLSRKLGLFGLGVTLIQVIYLAAAFFSSGPLVAGGLVTILGFSAVGIWVLLVGLSIVVAANREPASLTKTVSSAPANPEV